MINTVIIIAALLGIAISWYTYMLEESIKKNAAYKPACDLSDKFSCSAPLKSSYGHLFFISNAQMGLIYYTTLLLTTFLELKAITLLLTTIGLLYSLYLAYILIVKIKSICIVCISLYLINALLFCSALYQYYAV